MVSRRAGRFLLARRVGGDGYWQLVGKFQTGLLAVDLTVRAGGKKPLPRLILLLAVSVSNAGEKLAAGMKVHADSLP